MEFRESVHLHNHGHGATPIPAGCRVGNIVFSSGIFGVDPDTGVIPQDPELQVRLVFDNVRRFMEEAGGSVDEIGKMTVYLSKEEYRELLNRWWLEMFPNSDSRPARHSIISPLRNGAIIEVEIIAVLKNDYSGK